VRLVAERHWLSTLLLYIPQWLFALPVLVMVLPALWKRDRAAALVNAGALAMVAGPMMSFNVPAPRLPWGAAPKGRIRVLAYNILSARAGRAHVLAKVRHYRPEVIVFSEMPEATGGLELIAAVKELSPEWTAVQSGEMCLMSRWPVLDSGFEPLRSPTADRVDRHKVRMRIQAPFGRFTLIGAHFITAMTGQTMRNQRHRLPAYLTRTGAIRWEQSRDLLRWAEAESDPVILAGDFNTPPAGMVYAELRRKLSDSFVDAGWGWGFTFPSRLPQLRIDYIFHSPSLRTIRCEVGSAAGSDHRPVFAVLDYR